MRNISPYARTTLFILLSVCLCSTALGQATAHFTSDITEGCAPVVVNFNNTSTGVSPTTAWNWDFGNGNRSSLQNPAVAFVKEGAYTVTLTVTEGVNTSTFQSTITVHGKPAFSFSTGTSAVCLPDAASFQASATGSDVITSWHWDFGDGNTVVTASPAVSHNYSMPLTASVSVTATSNKGCSNSIFQENLITASESPVVLFTSDQSVSCADIGSFQFTNQSSGDGNLSYIWNFGDGNTSAAISPQHTFNQPGTYAVQLAATNQQGCTRTYQLEPPITVGNLVTDFSIPTVRCAGKDLELKNTSFPVPESSQWFINGIDVTSYALADGTLNYRFPSVGTFMVKLINKYDGCTREVEKQISINDNPVLDGFIVNIEESCTAPWNATFIDTSAAAVAWGWNFNYHYNYGFFDYTTQTANHAYGGGPYTIRLQITDVNGCTAQKTKQIELQPIRPRVVFSGNTGFVKCEKFETTFTLESPIPVISYEWDFRDGTTSTEAQPTHVFHARYDDRVTVKYVLENGCTGIAESTSIGVFPAPVTDFWVDPEVCGNNRVHFHAAGGNMFGSTIWDFGDGSPQSISSEHRYQKAGTYSVTMMNTGVCGDTITKNNIITVKGPFPNIDSIVTNHCEGDRLEAIIYDGTTDAQKWTWDMGDGTILTYDTHQPVIKHRYAESRIYDVKLTTVKDGCTVSPFPESRIFVLAKRKPILSLDQDTLCMNEPMGLRVRGLDINYLHLEDLGTRYFIEKIELKSGQPYLGSTSYSVWHLDLNATISFPFPMNDSIRMIVRSKYFNCLDTTDYIPIVVKGAFPGFELTTPVACFKNPVEIIDTSKVFSGNAINTWHWDFGDGQILSSSQGGNIFHAYTQPGIYTVKLTIDDGSVCAQSAVATKQLTVNGVKALFTTSPGVVVHNYTVLHFNNQSMAQYALGQVSYEWDFGDGNTSLDHSPSHSYGTSGSYNVRLIATDLATGCSDTASTTVRVELLVPVVELISTTSLIGQDKACPPVQATFSFKLTEGVRYTRIVWDFGDGTQLENITTPTHVYTQAGSYTITVTLYDGNDVLDTDSETVNVIAPLVTLQASHAAVCPEDPVQFSSVHAANGAPFIWNMGDGNLITNTDSLLQYAYAQQGNYLASLIVKDVNGCATGVEMDIPVKVYPVPVISIHATTDIVCKDQPVQLTASGAATYLWSPSDGLSQPDISNPTASPLTPTAYTVTGTDVNGCRNEQHTYVNVAQPFRMQQISTATICEGESVQLNAVGAHRYTWINNVNGLSTTQTSNPVATPHETTSYTVVGYDIHNCYTDTTTAFVDVKSAPILNAGTDLEVIAGSANTLHTSGSPDIVQWKWTPSTFLNCDNCAAPVSTPLADISYEITARNQYNCIAKDTLNIVVTCEGSSIYIPTGFTPNNDGKNDYFQIVGQGVTKITSFQVFNRWGEVVFGARNFAPGASNGRWNGRFRGMDAPAGVYIYVLQMECGPDRVFERKGTVTLLR